MYRHHLGTGSFAHVCNGKLYLDDFLILGGCRRELEEVTRRMVQALRDAGFLVSPKSVLEPATGILFLGKFIDTCERKMWSHPRAGLQTFAQWVRLATATHPHPQHLNKVLGFIQWHVRPRKGMGPFLAAAYCCEQWGQDDHPPYSSRCCMVWRQPPCMRWSRGCPQPNPDRPLFGRGVVLLICGCVPSWPFSSTRRWTFSGTGRGRLSRK
jgi:hypothetical protein